MAQVQDFYPLSPLQEGMLFQTLYAPHSGVYVTQLNCVLSGLNVEAFERAWQQMIDRHSVLRSFFAWKDLKKPIQVVPRHTAVPLKLEDWRDLASAEQSERIRLYLQEDRTRGYELSKAPLMRLALLQLTDHEYQFVWSFHHLLLDGWSVSLLLKDLFTSYDALCRTRDLRLPAVRPYRDYIGWLQKQDRDEAEKFWRSYLEGFTTPTPMPIGAPIADPSSAAAKQLLHLTPELTARLHSFARQHQLTLSTIAHAAWALLLSRHSGTEEVVFGSVVSGRPADLAGAESMVGLFINTIPVRVKTSPAEGVLGWLKELQQQQAQARQYEHSSLRQVKEWSNVPRGDEMFQSVVVYENYPVAMSAGQQPEAQKNLKLSQARSTEQANFPLSLMVIPGEKLTLNCFYDARRYSEADVIRLLEHYQMILESIPECIEQQLANIPMLPAAERQRLLVEWNQTTTDYPWMKCAHELFEAQAIESPEATALVMGDEQLSYLELNRRANQLAHYLRRRGVGPEVRVGILLERSVEMLVAILAVVKSGGAYLPLDSHSPAERNSFMMRDAQISVLLTQTDLAREFAEQGFASVCLDSERHVIAQESVENFDSGVAPSNLAYVIYTSGSTGLPKGVMVEHRSLVNLLTWHQRAYGVTAHDRAAQLAGVAFDACGWEIWPYLTVGASVHIANEETRMTPAKLLDWFATCGITISFLTTALAETVLQEQWPSQLQLRSLLIGGDRVHAAALKECSFKLINNYGPTEYTMITTWGEVVTGSAQDPTIGRPIANTQIYILDKELEPVATGVAGEIYIGGHGLSRGYLNRAELTAERFIPDPYGANSGARLYRTGDLARWTSTGEIDFIGRIDHQVKLRGFRIELGEIEAVLEQHADVQSAAVIARDERLMAYVVPQNSTLSITGLRTFLEQKLPRFMVPHSISVLDQWPLTLNGKIDRKRLPDPEANRPSLEVSYLAPQTEVESTIANIWQTVLGLEKVGVNDNFFDLGGDSLLMLQLQSKTQAALKKEIPLIELFEHATVRAMSEHFTRPPAEASTFEDARERAKKQKQVLTQQRNRFKQQSGTAKNEKVSV